MEGSVPCCLWEPGTLGVRFRQHRAPDPMAQADTAHQPALPPGIRGSGEDTGQKCKRDSELSIFPETQ